MKAFPAKVPGKVQHIETSVFAVFSALAKEHRAINLSQGFPNFPINDDLIELVHRQMKKGQNQYAPMPGVPELREQIAAKVNTLYHAAYDPGTEITITAGATQGLYSAISSVITPGDEVIVFEPAYDAYVPTIRMNGGKVRYVKMHAPDFAINWDEVRKAVNEKTRMIILNSPHNPTGSILGKADIDELDDITSHSGIIILSDEVYEHLVFDGARHESLARYPSLASRAMIAGSFGKTFHATGWKVGYMLAPANLTGIFRKVHQFVVFAVNTPAQYAIAEYLQNPSHYLDIAGFYQEKRDYFSRLIAPSRFKIIPCKGTYFQLLDYSAISGEKEEDFAKRLITEYGVAAVPVSAFYHDKEENRVLRFCFAKTDETLEKAAGIINKI
ncbi:MAG: methionine aminotransferase [Bacteroidales bacterium]|nr:methionine aminotransferase [Bacteroidales bacterium]